MSTIEQPLLTVRDVAATLNVSPSTVRRYIRQGSLPGVRFAGSVRVDAAALEAFLAPVTSEGEQR
jgi:excisionase family DNA binding protein